MGFFESFIIGISIAAIPGPIFVELIRRTLTKGFLNGISLCLGEFFGNFILLSLIFFGISNILTSPLSKLLLYLVGGIILFWLGVSAFRIKEIDLEKQAGAKITAANSLILGFTIAITSPIVIALWISLSGSYLESLHSNYLAFLNIFCIAFGILFFFFVLSSLISFTKQKLPSKYVLILSKIFGVVLMLYGLSFFYHLISSA